MTIKQRLICFAVSMLAMFAIILGINLYQQESLMKALHHKDLMTELVQNQMEMDMMHDALRGDVLSALQLGPSGSAENKKALLDDLKDHQQRIKSLYEKNIQQDVNKNIHSKISALKEPIWEYADQANRIVRMAIKEAGDVSKEYALFQSRFGILEETLAATNEIVFQHAVSVSEEAEALSSKASKVFILTIVFSVLLVLGFLLWLAKSILNPLKAVFFVTEELRSGDGDLTIRLPEDATEIGLMTRSINGFIKKLHDAVENIKGVNDVIKTASTQILTGSGELSRRTESQASALDETAASMQEFTVTVRQNADNAKLASEFSNETLETATRGGVVVKDVVSTMGAISDSSKKIADIISVIDEIAFQTNLLALNAAVEAARAGEQGRGFAVVAAEVRSLAQRAAAAAKEIKELISRSVDTVNAGYALVNEAGDTMSEIVEAVNKVNSIISDIAAASQEQSSSIEQVNEAVSHMDSATQQNVAVAQESNAVVKLLEIQVQNLNDSVSLFKVESDLVQGDIKNYRNNVRAEKEVPSRRSDVGPKPALVNDWKEF